MNSSSLLALGSQAKLLRDLGGSDRRADLRELPMRFAKKQYRRP
jgi:hypothetical protein